MSSKTSKHDEAKTEVSSPKIKMLFFSCLLIASCSTATGPKTGPSPVQEKTAVKDKNSLATLVKTDEAKQFPHLKRHVGQLLIANGDTQVLLPAAPPLSTGQSYFALLSKVYQRGGREWLEIPWLPSLEIKMLSKSSEPLQLIGQDIVQDAGNVTIHAFFRQQNSGAADAQLVLNIIPNQARIDVKVISKVRVPWTLRIGRGLGEDHSIPYKGNLVAGLTSSLLPHAVSIVGDQPFEYKQDDSYSYLEASPGGSGFKILVARDALLKQAELVQELTGGYQSAAAGKTARISKGVISKRKISAPAAKAGEKGLWQAAMIYTKAGAFRSLIPIREGETLEIPLLGKEKMDVLYADAEGVLQKKAFPLKASSPLLLPPMKKGSLELNLNPAKPTFVEIQNAVQRNAKSLHAWVDDPNKILLSPNTMLQSKWPLSMPLPAGDYQLRIYDGYQIYCDQRITILGDRKTTSDCAEPKDGPNYSVRASVSVDRAAVPDDQIAASGIRVVTSSEKPKSADNNLIEIPMLAAYDSELGLSMRAFPINEETEKSWNLLLRDKPDRSTLTHFHDFIREKDPKAGLVLDCPPPGFQLAEYNWIVQSIKPDVLEVFGCQQPELSQDLLQVANRLQAKQNKPVRLAAASFMGSLFGSRVPSIYLPRFKRSAKIDAAQAIEDLREGRYTLGFRTELSVPEVNSNDNKIALVIRSSDAKRRQLLVRIYDQDEKLNEESFNTADDLENEISVNLRLKSTSRWLRVEVLTRENAAQEDGPLFTLATSNFFGLDGKL